MRLGLLLGGPELFWDVLRQLSGHVLEVFGGSNNAHRLAIEWSSTIVNVKMSREGSRYAISHADISSELN